MGNIFLGVFARIVKVTHFAQIMNLYNSNLHNVFLLKPVSITNIGIENYVVVLLDNNKKKNKQKMKNKHSLKDCIE